MTAAPPASTAPVLPAVLRFTAAQAATILLLALALGAWVWSDPAGRHAIGTSAWVAFLVQIVTFSICKLVAQQNLMAGWGIGTLLRFATVGIWAFLGIKSLGLAPTPALLSLVTFLFVSTIIEPFFLNK